MTYSRPRQRMASSSHDWRKAIRTPLSYSLPSVSSRLMRQQTNFVSVVILAGAFILLSLYLLSPSADSKLLDDDHGHLHGNGASSLLQDCSCSPFDPTYPLSEIETLNDGRLKYRIAAVADLDHDSKLDSSKAKWASYMLNGFLIFDPHSLGVEVVLDETSEEQLTTDFSSGGRGAELSELVVFNRRLLTCDDRTGIVYEIRDKTLLPWVILPNGNGKSTGKGFKCEWMTVRDRHLYIGGLGKEWTTPSGDKVLNHDPQFVKKISPDGVVEHIDWRLRYIEMRKAAGIEVPGYLIHESAVWSERNQRWYFLPRRASHEPYDDVRDEQRGSNIFITADGEFTSVTQNGTLGPLIPTHGFSSVKLLPLPPEVRLEPENSEILVALKSVEDAGSISTYITVFKLPEGRVLLPEKQISAHRKYEGFEFV